MKFRTDYVTNSSSSSFIISTTEAFPEKYSGDVFLITEDNFNEVLGRLWLPEKDDRFCPGLTLEEFQELGHFTDEQMLLICMEGACELDTYLELKEKLRQDDAPVYYAPFVDRNYLHQNEELERFLRPELYRNEQETEEYNR